MENGTKIVNLDECEYSDRHGTYGGQAGLKDGIVYHGENWLVKYPKSTKGMSVDGLSYTTSPLSEYIGSHIYGLLGLDTHETMLAVRNGRLVVACKDFRADDEMLIEIRTIKNAANKELAERLDRDFSETGSQHMINLEELLLHLENNDILRSVNGIKERFWNCVIVDILINNNDRNNGNWGIIRRKNCLDRLAPIFDNGACFSNKMPEEKVVNMLRSDEAIKASALNTVTGFCMKGKMLSAKNILEIDNADLKASVIEMVPRIKDNIERIKSFVNSIPEKYNELYVCGKARAEFYNRCMECRMKYLLEPVYQKALEDVKGQQPNQHRGR